MGVAGGLVLEGVVPVIPTPFEPASEALDLDGLERLVEFAVALDIGGICLPAYASEFYKLDEEERFAVVRTAIRVAAGRVPIVAQSNHPSARVAAAVARRNAELGADVISVAVPRMFGITDADVLDFCVTVCEAVDRPVLVQDFNPGGQTIDAAFCERLLARCANFRYVKLEEPLMGEKVRAIRAATSDQLGVLEGWGGMYTLELLPAGICGLMPGLGAADLLARVWRLGRAGEVDEAFAVFEKVLPQLVFSLQNMELFLHVEKRLLVRRGVLSTAAVRRASLTPDEHVIAYAEVLNKRIVAASAELAAPHALPRAAIQGDGSDGAAAQSVHGTEV